MKPKKAKTYMEGIAGELDIHEDLVEAFVGFYYDTLRQTLSDLVYPKVYVNNLGTFNIRIKSLENNIKKHKDILGNLKKTTYNGYEKSVAVKKKIEIFEKAMLKINQMKERKAKFRKNGME
jgi:hypothetical protein